MCVSPGAIGVTVKSGWAAAVLVAGTAASPSVVDSCRVELSDPQEPDARQPYHDGFGTARAEGPGLSRLVRSVERFGRRSVQRLLARYTREGHRLARAGVVVGSLIDPDGIDNSHIRIHALEGQLFRRVVTEAAAAGGVECTIWRERDLLPFAAGVLGFPEAHIRQAVSSIGRGVAGSWRAEQKAAALAAWLVLSGDHRPTATGRNGEGRGRSRA